MLCRHVSVLSLERRSHVLLLCLLAVACPVTRVLALGSVVGDLMAKAGYRMASVVELDKYVKRPRVSGSPRVQVGLPWACRAAG